VSSRARERRLPPPPGAPWDLPASLGPLAAGPGDPTLRVARGAARRATRTPEGPASLHVRVEPDGSVRARAFGPGADWVLETLPDWLGAGDRLPDGWALPPAVRGFARRARGLRLARTGRVLEVLAPVVLQQKVAGREALRAWRRIVRSLSEPAPGPDPDLWLPPSAGALRRLPGPAEALGLCERRAAVLREVGWRAARLEEVAWHPDRLGRRLRALPGVGPWTAAEVLLRGAGDSDAVPVGDLHLPSLVAWNLAGEARADDARMLALLAPCRGQRGRVLRWLLAAGALPPRRAPRPSLRPLPSLGRRR